MRNPPPYRFGLLDFLVLGIVLLTIAGVIVGTPIMLLKPLDTASVPMIDTGLEWMPQVPVYTALYFALLTTAIVAVVVSVVKWRREP